MNEKRIQTRIKKAYRFDLKGIKSNRFIQDLSEGYKYSLGDRATDVFISVLPHGSDLEKKLLANHHFDLSYDLEQTIEHAICSLMCYGKAYVYIDAKYDHVGEESDIVLTSLKIGEIKGIIASRNDSDIEFWGFGPLNNIYKNIYSTRGFIELNIKDAGYSCKSFKRIAKELEKCDITSSKLIFGETKGYDFKEHMLRNRIRELRLTRKYGWYLNGEDLSESQYLYRRIQLIRFKTHMIKYVLKCINRKLHAIEGIKSEEMIEASFRNVDYDDLWNQYTLGRVTTSELSKLIA